MRTAPAERTTATAECTTATRAGRRGARAEPAPSCAGARVRTRSAVGGPESGPCRRVSGTAIPARGRRVQPAAGDGGFCARASRRSRRPPLECFRDALERSPRPAPLVAPLLARLGLLGDARSVVRGVFVLQSLPFALFPLVQRLVPGGANPRRVGVDAGRVDAPAAFTVLCGYQFARLAERADPLPRARQFCRCPRAVNRCCTHRRNLRLTRPEV